MKPTDPVIIRVKAVCDRMGAREALKALLDTPLGMDTAIKLAEGKYSSTPGETVRNILETFLTQHEDKAS